jgi:hypothetical protein
MYNCTGTDRLDDPHGSTHLHKDMTDAVNMMVWAANLPDGSPGYALWHLFPPAIAHILRQFLKEEGLDGPGDIINAQCVYLGTGLLDRLADRYNVRPFVIYQHPGEAVFIPANWAHQVGFHTCFEYCPH